MSGAQRILANEDFVRCRSLGHVWDDFAPIHMRTPQFGVRLSYRCERCGTERHDTISRVSGDLLHRQYRNHPDGYATDKQSGEERPTAKEMRATLFKFRRKLRNTKG